MTALPINPAAQQAMAVRHAQRILAEALPPHRPGLRARGLAGVSRNAVAMTVPPVKVVEPVRAIGGAGVARPVEVAGL